VVRCETASQGGWGAMQRRDHGYGQAVDGESVTDQRPGRANGGALVAGWVVWAVRM